MNHNINNQQSTNSEPSPTEQRSQKYNMVPVDLDDVRLHLTVRRSSGEPDPGWLVGAEGVHPENGRPMVELWKYAQDDEGKPTYNPDGSPQIMVKIQDLEEVMQFDAQHGPKRVSTVAEATEAPTGYEMSPYVEESADYRKLNDARLVSADGQPEQGIIDVSDIPVAKSPEFAQESAADVFRRELASQPAFVQGEVLDYVRVQDNIRESERAKNFALVAEEKRTLFEVGKNLSPEARDFLHL